MWAEGVSTFKKLSKNFQKTPNTYLRPESGGEGMWAEGVSTFKRTKLWTILTCKHLQIISQGIKAIAQT